ncbi:TetR/AcrR family transcriptional regulator [Frankia sp. CNm7]|uniref:TetR/AcrR family transcriptional regulator n=1 Tax=Frankia nepalensis TaxID=1836974 RepID=A0A937RLX8_9ACTN|nr:TetR/AcrR family transcriptional regulator [Frankia nepalensis]MBL7495935.1 TetR/AcrR family transcriptional regulator [Frankia nepalensis]MBL7513592.1 TetR/AcrR family transcriptional regulator [Frankia nepalensis]MBL7524026.1 TetR/AcrR family transcriptional regulator [Frankia nepalensis]MBL7632660.1 TetR/AcrR family transcriptional regulator [Frankia nepalensis]
MTSKPRTRAGRGEGGRLAEEILLAAEQLLVEAGTEDAVTLRAVAERVGVTTPSVYLHFADKSALLAAVCLKGWAELGATMAAAAEGVADPFEVLRRYGASYVRFGLDHPVQYRLLLMTRASAAVPAGGQPGVTATDVTAAEVVAATAALDQITQVTQLCIDAGLFRGEAQALALSMWAAVHGCVSLLLSMPRFPWPPIEEYVDRTLRMIGFGAGLISRVDAPAGTFGSEVMAAEFDATAARLAARRSAGAVDPPPADPG